MAGGVDLKDSRQNLNLSFNLIWDLWRIKVTDHFCLSVYFHAAIKLYGKDWKKVTKYVRTRISAQVRSHAQKVLRDYSPGPATENDKD